MAENNNVPAVFAKSLKKVFVNKKNPALDSIALNGIDLTVPKGGLVALVGPDGAGKTTFMRLVCGLLTPTSGELEVFGMNTVTDSEAIQERIAYMPQRFGLYQDLSIKENMDLFANLQGVPEDERKEKYDQLFAMTGLAPFTDRLAGRLSGGMKQKLALACALIHDPDLLILDEPTAGVDPVSRQELWKILKTAVAQKSMSVLVSTAYLEEAAMCHDVYIINKGVILAKGTPEMLTEPYKDRVYFAQSEGRTARQMLDAASQASLVLDSTPSGDGVRVLLSKDADLKEAAKELGVPSLSPLPPRLEDAFMSLLIAADKPQKDFGENVEVRNTKGDDSKPVIVVENLVKKFGDFTAVDDTSFSVTRGEIFGLLGPNGAGKSTTILMMLGLTEPTSGTVEICGINSTTHPIEVKRKIGYLPEDVGFYDDMTGPENLIYTARLNGIADKEAKTKAMELMKRVGLEDQLGKKTGKYSRGMRQRLGLADVLIKNPEIIILDEPTSGIDPAGVQEFIELIRWLSKEEGLTVLFSSHHLDQVQKVCDRVGLFSNGQLLALIDMAELKDKKQELSDIYNHYFEEGGERHE